MSQNKVDLLQKAIRDNPDDAFPYFALAKTYEKMGNISYARHQYEHLIRHFPDYSGTYYHFVLLLIEEKEFDLAEKICDQGLQVLQQGNDRQLYNELLMLREQHLD